MPDTVPRPDLSDASQKDRALWHMKEVGELDRKVALDEYGIGRLAARIRDLRDQGYRIDSRKDNDGIAHYSLVDEPGGRSEPGEAQSSDQSRGATDVQTAEDLWRALPEGSLARDYVALLARCAKGDQTVGMLEEAVEPEGVSDWEAAALVGRDVTVQAITDCREKLCRASPLVKKNGYRKGSATYALHDSLTDPL
ncbi:helix-turn-helix domain-containing protein [Salinibacter altiplanensis]|uniref:helix-turn-helix domain-containing protein n=1 Tax=Salinibacter altiplanensis TaxID=1803181 RepID=UPI000C9FA570|nr:helix-turn-helix domain-containing protein [Salinibacter altiplanensis]